MGETNNTYDSIELQKRGIAALVRELGEVGAISFLHLYDRGSGDYTKERHNYFKHLNVDEISSAIMEK
ncbi:MAG: hypothetical protein LBV40_01925 [Methanomicrobiales archaeon]|jgi:hypothetical protein|nr:hypothetical protein [Methanomicrobiales archaeon]